MILRRRGASAVAVLVVIALAGASCSSETSRRATPTTTTRPFPPAEPARVLVIGDSNVFLSGAEVDAALRAIGVEPTLRGVPALGVNHYESYWSNEVPKLLETEPDIVVVGLGTNDASTPKNVDAFPGRLDQMMELFGDRAVIWITHVDDRPAAAEDAGRTVNEMIRAASERWANLTVLDFTVTINAYPSVLEVDELHFSEEGKKVYAKAIADAVSVALLAGALSDRD